MDLLIGHPAPISTFPGRHPQSEDEDDGETSSRLDSHRVVTRVVLHGNIPGSYPFNSHRRSRWLLNNPPYPSSHKAGITSESRFPDYHKSLIRAFEGVWPEKDMSEGMVIVRNWNGRDYEDESESPSNSAIWIGGKMDEDLPLPASTAKTNRGMAFYDDNDDDDDDWDAVEDIGHERAAKRGVAKKEDGWLKNTKLFKFPGLMFEVMEGGAVSALTVY